MDGNTLNIYHHKFSSRDYDFFLSADVHPTLHEEFVRYPMRQLYEDLSAGHIKGRVFLQFLPGPAPYKLLVCCEFCEEINILEYSEQNSQELRKWLKKEPGAWEWSHAAQYACSLEGKSTGWKEKCEKLRERVKRVIDCDLTADPIVAPGTLPPVDFAVSIWSLDAVSKDKNDFQENLRKMAALLKVGGQVVLFGTINGKSVKVGEHVCHILNYDEEFLRTSFRDTGFVIECLKTRPKADIGDFYIYDSFAYVRARKVREV